MTATDRDQLFDVEPRRSPELTSAQRERAIREDVRAGFRCITCHTLLDRHECLCDAECRGEALLDDLTVAFDDVPLSCVAIRCPHGHRDRDLLDPWEAEDPVTPTEDLSLFEGGTL